VSRFLLDGHYFLYNYVAIDATIMFEVLSFYFDFCGNSNITSKVINTKIQCTAFLGDSVIEVMHSTLCRIVSLFDVSVLLHFRHDGETAKFGIDS
jgi:hypothetical protein